MARLIPDTILPDQYSPQAERRILAELGRETTISQDWVVLHSLKLSRHVTRMQGEADFLVMVPDRGFIVVEVKGCGVERTQGEWTYHYDPPRKSTVGPFRQAEEAMRSLQRWLENNGFSESKNILFHSCVVFTEFDFRQSSPEWEHHEIINRSDIEAHGIVGCLRRLIDLRHALIAREINDKPDSYAWYRSLKGRPDRELVESISNGIRGNFIYEAEPENDLNRRLAALDDAIRTATEQQAAAVIGAFRNPRVLLTGAAGTGKTFVAVKLATMWSEQGLKVGLFCFNQLLAQDLRRSFVGGIRPSFVGTLDAFMLQLLGESPPESAAAGYWKNMRSRALEAACNEDELDQFDLLVVDEAQDLVDETRLDFLDLILDGSLKAGKWAMFGDFTRQAIYSSGADGNALVEEVDGRASGCFQFPLTTNCRNSSRVASNISLLGGLEPPYPIIRNDSIQGAVNPYFCKSEQEKQTMLNNLVQRLVREFEAKNVVILSPFRKSLAFRSRQNGNLAWVEPLRLLDSGESVVRFGTIHAFKGLEAKAVIITDCDWESDDRIALLYVALSRAEIEAHIILDDSQRQKYRKRILES